jgi:hypothetical protein
VRRGVRWCCDCYFFIRSLNQACAALFLFRGTGAPNTMALEVRAPEFLQNGFLNNFNSQSIDGRRGYSKGDFSG